MTSRACIKSLLSSFALLIISPSFAGGESWKFTITAYSTDSKDEFVVELTPVEKGAAFPKSCATLTISGEYASMFWLLRSGGPSKTDHKAALSMLRSAFSSKTQIEFGWIGDGLEVTSNTGKCVARSRGLMVASAVRSDAVYSYFKWP
jgi:hypothetical protein